MCDGQRTFKQNNSPETELRLFFAVIQMPIGNFCKIHFFCICDRKTWKGIHLKVSRFVLFFEVLTNAVLANDCGVELITLSRCLFGALVYISRAS